MCASVCGKTAAHVEKVGERTGRLEEGGWKKRKEVGYGRLRGNGMEGREEVEKSRGRQTKGEGEGERWK